jgi:hypothetical protein
MSGGADGFNLLTEGTDEMEGPRNRPSPDPRAP